MKKFEKYMLYFAFLSCTTNTWLHFVNNRARENTLRNTLTTLEILTERHNEAINFINSLNDTCKGLNDTRNQEEAEQQEDKHGKD